MSWEDENIVSSSPVRPKIRVYDDEQEFAAVPAVFGVKKVGGVAVEHTFVKKHFRWRSEDVTYTSEDDPSPVLRRLEKIRTTINRYWKTYCKVEQVTQETVRIERDYVPGTIQIPKNQAPERVTVFRTSKLVRWVKRIHVSEDGEELSPVGGDFGSAESSTINDCISSTEDIATEFRSNTIKFRDDVFDILRDAYEATDGAEEGLTNEELLQKNTFPEKEWYTWCNSFAENSLLQHAIGEGIVKGIKTLLLSLLKEDAVDPDTATPTEIKESAENIAAIFDAIDAQNVRFDQWLRIRAYDALNAEHGVREWVIRYTADNDATYIDKFYTGRVAFCYGELDKFLSLHFDDNKLDRDLEFGDNRIVDPWFFGGPREEGGEGGLGSKDIEDSANSRPDKLRLFAGTQDQLIKRYGSGVDRANYRGTSILAFDGYNFGGGPFPSISATVQRTTKLLTGQPQWYPTKATVCSLDSVRGGDFTFIWVWRGSGLDDPDHDNPTWEFPKATAVAWRSMIANFTDAINNGAKINCFAINYGTSNNGHWTSTIFMDSDAVVAAGARVALGSTYDIPFKLGTGVLKFGRPSNLGGLTEIVRSIDTANTDYGNDRPIYAFMTLASGHVSPLDDMAIADLATIRTHSNVSFFPVTLLIRDGAAEAQFFQIASQMGGGSYIRIASDTRVTVPDPLGNAMRTAMGVGVSSDGFLNPVHALRELMTDKEIGYGIPENLLDNGSFQQAADTCAAEDLCCSFILDDSRDTEQMFQVLKRHINCEIYDHPVENKIKIKLIRQDYEVDELPVLGTNEIGEVSQFEQRYNQNEVGGVTVTYKSYENENKAVTVLNPILQEQGHETIKINYEAAPTYGVALRIAKRELASRSRPIRSFDVTLPVSNLYPGDPVRVNFSPRGLVNTIMRVRQRDVDDTGFVTLQLVEDVFGDVIVQDSTQNFVPIPVPLSGWGYDWGNTWSD